jgi:hypothetical protein
MLPLIFRRGAQRGFTHLASPQLLLRPPPPSIRAFLWEQTVAPADNLPSVSHSLYLPTEDVDRSIECPEGVGSERGLSQRRVSVNAHTYCDGLICRQQRAGSRYQATISAKGPAQKKKARVSSPKRHNRGEESYDEKSAEGTQIRFCVRMQSRLWLAGLRCTEERSSSCTGSAVMPEQDSCCGTLMQSFSDTAPVPPPPPPLPKLTAAGDNRSILSGSRL